MEEETIEITPEAVVETPAEVVTEEAPVEETAPVVTE